MKPAVLALAIASALSLGHSFKAHAEEATDSQHSHGAERARRLDQLVVTATPLGTPTDNIVQPVEVLAGEALDDRRAGTLG
jgi:iron complex outermembrane recepter protein